MHTVLHRAKGNLLRISMLSFFYIILALMTVFQALATRRFVDFAAGGDMRRFLTWFAIYFALVFSQILLGSITGYLYDAVTVSIGNSFKRYYCDVALSRDYSAITRYHSGDLMQRLFTDVSTVAGTVVWLPCEVCSLLASLIAAASYLAILEWKLTLLLLATFGIMSIAALPLRGLLKRHQKRVMECEGAVRGFLQELIDHSLVIRTFQAGAGVGQEASRRLETYRAARLRQKALSLCISTASSAAVNLAYVIGLAWCGVGIVHGTVSFGTLSAVWQLIGQITGPAKRITNILPQYYTMTACAERLNEIENLPEEQKDPNTDWDQVADGFRGIELTDVAFSYTDQEGQTKDVLSGLNLTVCKGDFIAVTGASGIGKSTLLKLLLGVYTPITGSGCVRWGDGCQAPLDAGIRRMSAYVPQGSFLMSGTIREAIVLGTGEDADPVRLEEACRAAQAWEFITQLPLGLDTALGERGAGLSEGQLQRIAIARAIYSRKPILLLDEATSALDEETEAQVLENLRQLSSKTVIIVTHRRKALEICNREVILNQGKVCEQNGLEPCVQ